MAFDAQKLGSAVKQLRIGSGYTQAELGQQMGLTQAAVVMIEQGKRGVSMETLDKLGKALNVPAECLSILAFRSMSNAKEIADLSQSLQKLIFAVVDARTSTTKQNENAAPSRVRSKPPKAASTPKARKRVTAART